MALVERAFTKSAREVPRLPLHKVANAEPRSATLPRPVPSARIGDFGISRTPQKMDQEALKICGPLPRSLHDDTDTAPTSGVTHSMSKWLQVDVTCDGKRATNETRTAWEGASGVASSAAGYPSDGMDRA
eukprot:scaffold1661_cov251-Pinguiococcus_pyrenoidosus.AAC.44